jgi:hypothetical protein
VCFTNAVSTHVTTQNYIIYHFPDLFKVQVSNKSISIRIERDKHHFPDLFKVQERNKLISIRIESDKPHFPDCFRYYVCGIM